jgi:branched-subunit amino acid ABC-type transport system permease component
MMDTLNAIVALTDFVIVPGIAYGPQLALGALGVTLIYCILQFSNFAHGDTLAFGTAISIPMVKQSAMQTLKIAQKGCVLVQRANAFTDTGRELLADPQVRKSFLGG